MGGPEIAIIGLVLSATGLVMGYMEQKKAGKRADASNKLRREAEEKSEQVANLQNLRAKRAAAREAQAKRADITSTGVAQNVVGSSAVRGSRGSVSTQLSSNLSFLDNSLRTNTQATRLFGEAQDLANQPGSTLGKSLASFGGTVFSGSEKISKGLNTVFG